MRVEPVDGSWAPYTIGHTWAPHTIGHPVGWAAIRVTRMIGTRAVWEHPGRCSVGARGAVRVGAGGAVAVGESVVGIREETGLRGRLEREARLWSVWPVGEMGMEWLRRVRHRVHLWVRGLAVVVEVGVELLVVAIWGAFVVVVVGVREVAVGLVRRLLLLEVVVPEFLRLC